MMDRLDWLGHIIEAVVMASIVTAIAWLVAPSLPVAALCGLFFAAGHFHGREKRDYENKVAMPPPHLKAYLIWRWSWDQLTDFVPVAVVCWLLAQFAVPLLNQ